MNGMHGMDGHGVGKRHRDDLGSHGDGPHGQMGPPRKRKEFEPMPPNHILLFTILNPVYPITVDILHTICKPTARVLRIVIFQKNGVQAMVEFESVEAACAVSEALNGADIYSGCCTLKIEFAKPTRLNVNRNDSRSWDYTLPGPGQEVEPPPKKAPLLPEPPAYPMGGMQGGAGGGGGYEPRHGGHMDDIRDIRDSAPMRGSRMAGPGPDRYGGGGGAGADRYGGMGGSDRGGYGMGGGGGGGRQDDYGYGGRVERDYGRAEPYPAQESYGRGGMGGGRPRADDRGPVGMTSGGGPQQGCVLMVYDMDKNRMNPDRLFNIFCQYGNVMRIKFLKSKEGCAMIQMEDQVGTERVLDNLNSLEFFGCRMQLSYSKQPYLNAVQQPHTLPDGTSSYADFSRNRNNRFLDPAKASKNRIQAPSRVLHFYNMPPGVSNEEISELFTSRDVAPPESIKLFPSRSERSCSGLLEFGSVAEAVEALAVVNHIEIPHSSSKFPFTLKLCFSTNRQGGGGPPRGGDRGQRDDRAGDGGDQYF